MAKVLISIGYKKYILDTEEAIRVTDILSSAEIYESKYRSQEDGGSLHYVYPQSDGDMISLSILSDNLYRCAKLAGKPEKT